MADHFFDTSAIGKHYHQELGSPKVDALLATPGVVPLVSRLTVVEIQSVFAKKVRTGVISAADFHLFGRRFRADVRAKRLTVIRVTAAHYQTAERLIRRLAPTRNLRTLDSIQLAVALGLHDPAQPVPFVCADQALCGIAAAEGLIVINPEIP
jgi:predicted nucleic acid-binding protein